MQACVVVLRQRDGISTAHYALLTVLLFALQQTFTLDAANIRDGEL